MEVCLILIFVIDVESLRLLTDVPGVYADWPSRENLLRDTTTETLAPLALADGAMGPKVGAAIGFVSGGGRFAAIGALDQAAGLLAGDAGTILRS